MPILSVICTWDISGIINFYLVKKCSFCRFFSFLQYLTLILYMTAIVIICKKRISSICCMICTGNLILRTMVLEYFNNSL